MRITKQESKGRASAHEQIFFSEKSILTALGSRLARFCRHLN